MKKLLAAINVGLVLLVWGPLALALPMLGGLALFFFVFNLSVGVVLESLLRLVAVILIIAGAGGEMPNVLLLRGGKVPDTGIEQLHPRANEPTRGHGLVPWRLTLAAPTGGLSPGGHGLVPWSFTVAAAGATSVSLHGTSPWPDPKLSATEVLLL
jgi:hypothetical protein